MGCGGSTQKGKGLSKCKEWGDLKETGIESIDPIFESSKGLYDKISESNNGIVEAIESLREGMNAHLKKAKLVELEKQLKAEPDTVIVLAIKELIKAGAKVNFDASGGLEEFPADLKLTPDELNPVLTSLVDVFKAMKEAGEKLLSCQDEAKALQEQLTGISMDDCKTQVKDKYSSAPMKVPGALKTLADNMSKSKSVATNLQILKDTSTNLLEQAKSAAAA